MINGGFFSVIPRFLEQPRILVHLPYQFLTTPQMHLAYDFSTLYTTLPHNLIKDKLIDLIERTFQREGSPYLACNECNAFLLQKNLKNIMRNRVKMYVMR